MLRIIVNTKRNKILYGQLCAATQKLLNVDSTFLLPKTNVSRCRPFSTTFSVSGYQWRSSYVDKLLRLSNSMTLCSSTTKEPDDTGSKTAKQAAGSPATQASAGSPSSQPAAAAAAAPADTSFLKKSSIESITVKVQPTARTKLRPKTDFTQTYTANVSITPVRAMNEYLLTSSDLVSLSKTKRRSPYPEKEDITVYLRRDVERKAIEKWGSLENLQKEREKILLREKLESEYYYDYKKARRLYLQQHASSQGEKPFIFTPSPERTMDPTGSIFRNESGKVVLYAIAINAANCILKLGGWFYTGSHSMFSEFLHSLADTLNQILLALGIHQSLKQPDMQHPYGWSNFRHVSALISGVGIFCLGSGLSFYHGIMGLVHPEQLESIIWGIAILGGSFLSEGATLLVAMNQIRSSARRQNQTPLNYVLRGQDPSTTVVLMEDLAAIIGVSIAALCMGITHHTGNPMADAVGSLFIGTLLGGVASLIIYSNTMSLVGRSIPPENRLQMLKELEDDRMIRALHDVKATDMGGSHVRFKAEVDFDGREITRFYLENQDIDKMLQEMNSMKTIEEVEAFMLKHGENIVDVLGGEVDRIERNLKRKHPEVKHVDLEQL